MDCKYENRKRNGISSFDVVYENIFTCLTYQMAVEAWIVYKTVWHFISTHTEQ